MSPRILFVIFLAFICLSGGKCRIEIDPHVVNGEDATIEEFPFMVSIWYRALFNCGGTLLSNLWVLTAAHCVAMLDVELYFVQYASTTILNTSPNIVGVQLRLVHDKYSPSKQYLNDVGLVKLKAPLNITLSGYRVRLPVFNSYFNTGTPATLCGWGTNSTTGPLMKTLQKVDLQIFTSTDCAKLHEKPIHWSNVCAGGSKSQCSGDSGGPLLINGVQVGIVSWSEKPCGGPRPGVFTEVSGFIPWIENKTGIDFQLNVYLQSRI